MHIIRFSFGHYIIVDSKYLKKFNSNFALIEKLVSLKHKPVQSVYQHCFPVLYIKLAQLKGYFDENGETLLTDIVFEIKSI